MFEMPIQLGGDPCDFPACAALRAELAKMNHPACPEVNWAQVERWCLALFRENGAELQTAAFYVLACGHRFGLGGLAQSLVLIESLIREGSRVWPRQPTARVAILDGLFNQMASLLRRLTYEVMDVQALVDVHIALEQINRQLIRRTGSSSMALDTLCRHVAMIHGRVEPEQRRLVGDLLLEGPQSVARRLPESVWPVLPVIRQNRRRWGAWVALWGVRAGSLILFVVGGFFAWHGYEIRQSATVAPAPVQLRSLSVFDAGSAKLRPDSTAALVEALVSVKAKPGWLIVISGHSDGTGDAGKNLQLSRDRAFAVMAWLQRMGNVPDRCFAVEGLGGGEPVATDLAESGRAANRRVDIRLMPQHEPCHTAAGRATG
jgi:type VI secretion system protein VasL